MNRVSIVLIILSIIALIILNHKDLPPITLPAEFQHKTIGELPVVEVMDDGDFYEKDGDEDKYYDVANACYQAMSAQCDMAENIRNGGANPYHRMNKNEQSLMLEMSKKDCLEKAKEVCGDEYPMCSEVEGIFGAIWTCRLQKVRWQ